MFLWLNGHALKLKPHKKNFNTTEARRKKAIAFVPQPLSNFHVYPCGPSLSTTSCPSFYPLFLFLHPHYHYWMKNYHNVVHLHVALQDFDSVRMKISLSIPSVPEKKTGIKFAVADFSEETNANRDINYQNFLKFINAVKPSGLVCCKVAMRLIFLVKWKSQFF